MEKYHHLFKLKNTYKEYSTEIPKGQLDRLANCFVMFLITDLRQSRSVRRLMKVMTPCEEWCYF